jgi:hypothetical protein
MLAFRRQYHQEVATAINDHDATERRITDLYANAANQLGNDRSAVRLAGLYALERLAQNNAEHRQTIVNVICAYLRMPFIANTRDGRKSWFSSNQSAKKALQGKEERVVRQAAQTILSEHLRVPSSDWRTTWSECPMPRETKFWPNMNLNLDDATLIDFDFLGCRVERVDFKRTKFFGRTNFAHAEFHTAYFREAQFHNEANFFGAWFQGRINFGSADFRQKAIFQEAAFCGQGFFHDVKFRREVSFDAARARPMKNRHDRDWPTGWTERPLRKEEKIPHILARRWIKVIDPPGDITWNRVVKKGSSDE